MGEMLELGRFRLQCSPLFSSVLYMTNTPPTVGALFAGYDGIGMGLQQVLPHTVSWFSENDAAPSKVLAHRWPTVPNLGDMTAVDWSAVEPVDVITGGFPCTDLSLAGGRAGMHAGTRSGLWSHMATAIKTLRPSLVIAENVRGLLSGKAHSAVEQCPGCLDGSRAGHFRALGAVLGDLAEFGYDAQWVGLRASDVGAPHPRFRVFAVAHLADAGSVGRQRRQGGVNAGRHPAVGGEAGHHAGHSSAPRPVENADGAAGYERRLAAPTEAESRGARADAGRRGGTPIAWGQFGPAINRWESITGRDAPRPVEASSRGGQRLSPTFVEWMMGLPAGHVTDPAIGLTGPQQLKILGNGVVPQQAAAAIGHLLSLVPA